MAEAPSDAAGAVTPVTPSGAASGLALVGGYVLAGELAAAGGDHRIAFPRYEQIIRSYVTESQKLPPGGAHAFAPSSRVMISLSNTSMRMMNHWPVRPLLAKQFAKAGGIDLPDYEPAENGCPVS